MTRPGGAHRALVPACTPTSLMHDLTAVARLGMKTDGTGGKTPQLFLFLFFIRKNRSGSGIAGYGSGNGI